ncbi:hypothetical protein AVEN_104105-1 [Araneus ventricosus]|uniref:Uncharacterized protein n=1 Tax=Araneus ventricosus TaxID=182803 RepID=A0A4Y2JBA6_ARAVE|nr:hypothetical protein AVEN_104105-1 [Araneus ventricosus]
MTAGHEESMPRTQKRPVDQPNVYSVTSLHRTEVGQKGTPVNSIPIITFPEERKSDLLTAHFHPSLPGSKASLINKCRHSSSPGV